MSEGNVWSFWLWTVLCILVIIGMAYWFTRYVVGRGSLAAWGIRQNRKEMEILAQLTMGKDQRLVVAKVGQHCFILGVTAERISLLSEIPPEEAALWERSTEEPSENQASDFYKALGNVLKQRRGGER